MLKKKIAILIPMLAAAAYIPSAYATTIDASLTEPFSSSLYTDVNPLIPTPYGFATDTGIVISHDATSMNSDGSFNGGTAIANSGSTSFSSLLGTQAYAGENFDFTVNVYLSAAQVASATTVFDYNVFASGANATVVSFNEIYGGVSTSILPIIGLNAGQASVFYAQGETAALGAGWTTFELTGIIGYKPFFPLNAPYTTATYASFVDTGNLSVTPNIPPQPVPEPEQWAMLLMGLPLLSWIASRKRAA